MPTKKDAAYWRDRRARLKAEEVARDQPTRIAASTPVPKPSKAKDSAGPTESKYDCGCRPGELCLSHAIAGMDQKARDVLLDRISRVQQGHDSAKLRSFDDELARRRRA